MSSASPSQPALRGGFMPKGNDLHHARMTLGEAHAWCMAHDECRGFTYHASEPAPLDSVYVWFKSTDKVVAGAGWYSYVKAGGAGAGTGDGAPALVRAGSDKPSGAPKLGSLSLSSMFSSSHGRSQQGAQQPPPPASAALALLTRKPLHFEWWLRYHMQLGICHFFIHVEDTPELLPLLASEPYRGVVTISQKGDASHFKDNYWTLQDRQRAHVNTSLARAREMGIEWLFHVDDDELIWLDKPFAEVVAAAPKGTTNITFSNLEAIPTTVEPVNYFEHIHSFTKKRMLAYVNGKPVGRTVPETKLDGPHRFCGPSYAVPATDGAILHYESCDFNQWCAKFRNQVDCTPERKQSIPFPYYRDSISLFQEYNDPQKHMQQWLDFYRRRKIEHYNTAEIRAAARHITKMERPRMIDAPAGADAARRQHDGGGAPTEARGVGAHHAAALAGQSAQGNP